MADKEKRTGLDLDTLDALAKRIEDLESLLAARDERVATLTLAQDAAVKVSAPMMPQPVVDDAKYESLRQKAIAICKGSGTITIKMEPNADIVIEKDCAYVAAWVKVPLTTDTENGNERLAC